MPRMRISKILKIIHPQKKGLQLVLIFFRWVWGQLLDGPRSMSSIVSAN